MSRANTRELVGLVGVYRDVGTPCIYPDLMMRLVPDESVCLSSYLELALGMDATRKELRARARGTSESMVKVSAPLVQSLRVPVPPLDEQRRIVHAHEVVERRIAALERVREKLRVAEGALTAEALANFSSHGVMTRLESIATVVAGVTLGSEPVGEDVLELPYLRVANVLDGRIDTTNLKSVRILRSQYERYALRKGDLLLTEGGDLDKLGRGAVWDASIERCLHQNHVFRVRCGEDIMPDFLALYTSSEAGRTYFQSVGKQTTNLASINSTQVKAMPVPLVPLAEQERALGPIRSVRSRIAFMDRKVAKLRVVQRGVAESLLSE
ncbi:restriction endonuclease subunit S [Streptomyces sp. enrichment culture]|uniref:restriction endonuclease subunit S n=1 Tax=Streptomyces sp. enrichment culture TaxID=1795815 RepID=UPI003F561270